MLTMEKEIICNRCGKETEDLTHCDECHKSVCDACLQIDCSMGAVCKDCFTNEERENMPDLTPEEIKEIEDALARGESII